MTTNAVILAAGRGTRMRSGWAKALHELGGMALVCHVERAVLKAGLAKPWVVVGFQAERVEEVLDQRAHVVVQPELRGTGDALACALAKVPADTDSVVVLVGDCPLIPPSLIEALVEHHRTAGARATIVTTRLDDPTGYGRVVRGTDGQVAAIVEESECDDSTRQIREINTGIGIWQTEGLLEVLDRLPWHGEERYLTDAVAALIAEGHAVAAMTAPEPDLVMGINTRRELSRAEARLRQMTLDRLFDQGITIIDPDTTYVDAEVEIGCDTILYPMSFLRGKSRLGRGCRIGPMTTIVDSKLGDEVTIDRSAIEHSVVGSHSTVGPFSHLRAGTHLDRNVHVGNFVEFKNTRMGIGSKAGHHSYLGDATVGSNVNIGAGTVIVNFDGRDKHPTFIGDDAFVGCNTNLVAPLEIGSGAYVAAGSTITQNVPADSLAIARNRQENKSGWAKARRSEVR